MSQSDVEMEEAETVPRDSTNNFQELESEHQGAKAETREGIVPAKVSVVGGANKSENVGQDLNPVMNEEKGTSTLKSGMQGQFNHKDEEARSMNEQGLLTEQSNAKNEKEEIINDKSKVDEQITTESAEKKQIDVQSDVVELNSTNGGTREVNPLENGLEHVNHVKSVMSGKSSENGAEKEPKDIGRDDGDHVKHVAGEEKTREIVDSGKGSAQNRQLPAELSDSKAPQGQNAPLGEVPKCKDEKMETASNVDESKSINNELKEPGKEMVLAGHVTDGNAKTAETAAKCEVNNFSYPNQNEAATPNSIVRCSPAMPGDHSGQTVKTVLTPAALPLMAEGDDGTPEEQAAFMREIENFYRERTMEFKPPKFYGQPLNCLKLWRAVIRLGGYDRVTGSKLWRQVGESFHPPKTCTTVSWTFRIFYEKSLLEYEKHKRQSGELQLPVPSLAEASGVDSEGNGYQGSGPGRARRDAAARAMQGWHVQRLFGSGEVGEPIIKDKNLNNVAKREKNLKSIGSLKQKRPNEVEHPVKVARTETSKQLVTSVVDVGPPADWVKINVRQTKDCFEVYALVPGLLREEVRVQSDPAGRLVITGQPEQLDNPWGITPFKKVVSLPARIDPLQTSAVVSLHGRLFVRVPFEQSNV